MSGVLDSGRYVLVISNALGAVSTATACVRVSSSLEVTFVDPKLEAAVRSTLGIPSRRVEAGDMLGLTVLVGADLGITNLSGLEWALNLAELYLRNNKVGDLGPLGGLARLKVLVLEGNQITNIDVLRSCVTLENLWLGNNGIEDISPLAGLTNLTALGLWDNRVKDVSALGGHRSLGALSLNNNEVGDITPLGGLTNLTALYLWHNHVTEIGVLGGLSGLRELELGWGNRVADIGVLGRLSELESLGLSANPIGDISVLGSLMNLRSLDVALLGLSELGPITGLTNLERLELWGNPVEDIGGLGWLVNLRDLGVADGNRVTDIGVVGQLWRLENLRVSGNPIGDLSPVCGLTNLVYLEAANTLVRELGCLTNLWGLSYLDVRWDFLDLGAGGVTERGIDGMVGRGTTVVYRPQSTAPKISRIMDQTVPEGEALAGIRFQIGDDVTASGDLCITVTSSDTELLPPGGIEVRGSGGERTLGLRPAVGHAGRVYVTVDVSDGAESAGTGFWLTVLGYPVVLEQPVDKSLLVGDTLVVEATVIGAGPLTYQWLKDGTNVADGGRVSGARSRELQIMDANLADAGCYMLLISNVFGCVHSSPASIGLSTIQALAEALDASGLPWSSGGAYQWIPQAVTAYDGVAAGQSGAIGDGQRSWIQTTLSGPGTVSWWWKVSSQGGYDWLECYLDGERMVERLSGEVDWQACGVALDAGQHTLRWQYVKDWSASAGLDRAWVDRVAFLATSVRVCSAAFDKNSGEFSFSVQDAAGRPVVVETSTNLLNWVALSTNTLTGGSLRFTDTNSAAFRARFYRVKSVGGTGVAEAQSTWGQNR